jgi:CBS domain-containing protein
MTTARDIMSNKVVTMESDVSSIDIAKIMEKNKVSSVIITKDQKPIGIITERDLVSKIISQNKKPLDVKTIDIISSPLVVVNPLTPVDEVAEKMIDKKIRRVVVMDVDQPLGIITVTDFVKHLHKVLADNEDYKQDIYQHLIEDWEHWMP